MFLNLVLAAVLASATASYHSHEFCSPLALRYGYHRPEKTIFKVGEEITYSCGNKYTLDGHATAVCGGSTWDHKFPKCVEIPRCDKPPHLDYGYYLNPTSSAYYSIGSVITYYCPDHYELEGYSELTCLDTGNWSYEYPKCLSLKCDPPSVYDYLHYEPHSHHYSAGDEITYYCEDGTVQYGYGVSTCLKGGSWTRVSIKCKKACLPPAAVQNGYYSPRRSNYQPGETLTFYCYDNFSLRGPKTVSCSHHGAWPTHLPYCDTPKCYPPSKPENGLFFPYKDDYLPGEKIYFTCGSYYTLNGVSELLCTSSGYWAGNIPTCVEPVCLRPRRPKYGYFGPVKYTYKKDEAVWFACKKGYKLVGQKDIHCQKGGRWSFKEPVCSLPQCPADELAINYGTFYPKPYPAIYPVGIKVKFYCSHPYALKGPETIYCNQGGHWSHKPPVCEHGCQRPPFPQYGYIMPIKRSYAVGEQVWYKCLKGRRASPEADIVCLGPNYWSVNEVKCVTEESCKTKSVCGKVIAGRSCQCEAKFCSHYPHQCCSDFSEYCLSHHYY